MEIQQAVMAMLPLIAKVAGVFVLFWIGAGVTRSVLWRLAERDEKRREVIRLLAKGAWVSLMLFGAATALGTAGVDVRAIIAGLGLTGFALGFALKDLLSSALAGLMLLLTRPFVAGDRVAVAGFEGEVAQVDLRYTTLREGEKRFLIPNSTVLSSPVTVTPGEGSR